MLLPLVHVRITFVFILLLYYAHKQEKCRSWETLAKSYATLDSHGERTGRATSFQSEGRPLTCAL